MVPAPQTDRRKAWRPVEIVAQALITALFIEHHFRGILSLLGIITVGRHRINFQPRDRNQFKIVGEKCGDQKDECQKKYFDDFIHLGPSKLLWSRKSNGLATCGRNLVRCRPYKCIKLVLILALIISRPIGSHAVLHPAGSSYSGSIQLSAYLITYLSLFYLSFFRPENRRVEFLNSESGQSDPNRISLGDSKLSASGRYVPVAKRHRF